MNIEWTLGPDGNGGLDFSNAKINMFQVSFDEDFYDKPQLRISVGRGLVVNFSMPKYMLRELKNRIEEIIDDNS